MELSFSMGEEEQLVSQVLEEYSQVLLAVNSQLIHWEERLK